LLHSAGLFVGDDLIGALPYNPYGHYEDREVVRMHDQILRDNGLNWQVAEDFVPVIGEERWHAMESYVERRRLERPLWGFKDPRVCLFLPAWKHLMPDCKVLITFRRVADSSYSLSRRHALELFTASGPPDVHRRFFTIADLAPRMWLAHNRALIAFARRYPEDVLTVSFESLLRGFPLTRLIRRYWGAPLVEVPTFSAVDPLATTRRSNRQPLADGSLAEEIDAVWEDLLTLERETLIALDQPRPRSEPDVPADEYFVPTDLATLRMESELLTLENTFLKGRVAKLEQELRTVKEREAKARKAAERIKKPAS
jgi:hypothetical protein